MADPSKVQEIKEEFKEYEIIEISAKEGLGLEELLQLIGNMLPNTLREEEFLIPYSDQAMVAFLHRNGKIEEEDYREDGTYIKAIIEEEVFNKCSEFLLKK